MMKNTKNSQIWIKSTLKIAIIIILSVVLINFVNDPLWVYDHQNFTNNTRLGFNERQQKTNLLYFGKQSYDSIMLGNSKTTYIDQNKFKNGKLFNYAVSAMNTTEYNDYIEFFKKTTNSMPKNIILGIDFNYCLEREVINTNRDPEFYISNTTSKLYKLKHLLSYDTLTYSMRNFTKFLDKRNAIYYHENNKKIKIGFEKEKNKENDERDINYFINHPKLFNPNASYNEDLPRTLDIIQKNNQNSKFYIILLPDYMPYFTINENKKIYDRCVGDIKNIFGSKNVYNFAKFDKITINIDNYYDASHFRDYIGDYILKEITKNN